MALSLSLPQLGLSLAAGSLTTLSPCVFPLLPLVLGGAVQGSRLAPAAMGVGMTVSFAGIGMVLGSIGPALGIDSDTVRTGGAALLIAFALVMLVPVLGEHFTRWMLPIASSANAASGNITHVLSHTAAIMFGLSSIGSSDLWPHGLGQQARRMLLTIVSFVAGTLAAAFGTRWLGAAALLMPIAALLGLIPFSREATRNAQKNG